MEYLGGMKQKTSITLSPGLLAELDRLAGPGASRSAYIERVLRRHIRRRAAVGRDAADLAAFNRAAPRLNREMSDVLEFQARWDDDGGA